MKICSRAKNNNCLVGNIPQVLSAFSKSNQRKDGRSPQCTACRSYRARLARQRNPEQYRKYVRDYKARDLRRSRQRYADFAKRFPHKAAAKAAKRRAGIGQATPTWLTQNQIDEISFFYKVAAEFKSWTKVPLEVDHIVPIQGKNVSGLHVPWNLQILPRTLNLKKSNYLQGDL